MKIIISMLMLSLGHMAAAEHKLTPSAKSAAQGCQEVVAGEFEDGASFYRAVQANIIAPLKAEAATVSLAKFLESAIVVEGYLDLTAQVCESIETAVITTKTK